ncbi:hypothetical protein BH10PLA1_BH10PLA1_04010 [soil metagenome]
MSQPPPGQGPINPQGAFSPPPAPGAMPPPGFYPPMPPAFYPPPPPAKGRSFARAIFTTLATTIFGISILLNLYLLLLSGILNSRVLQQETVLEKGDPNNRIVVLSLNGIINEKSSEKFRKQLKTLEDDATCKALVVEVDSPGGSVTASDEIYHALMLYKAKMGKPIIINQGALAASGGYYVSCAGDYIVAQPSTLTGNIGVLFPRFNLSKMLDKWGIDETTLKAKGSPFKNAESMFKPETPEANAYLQEIVDEAYVQFRDVVVKGRSAALKGKIEDIANGKIYTADQALKLGLVDLVDYPEAAYAEAAKRARLGTVKPTIIRMKDTPGILELLGAKTGLGPAGASGTAPDLGNVEFRGMNIDAGTVYDLLTPRLMYLWNGG